MRNQSSFSQNIWKWIKNHYHSEILHRKILYKHSNGKGKKLPIKQVSPKSKTIDLDVDIKDFVVTSNEEKVENPKYLKNSLNRLKVL